MQAQRVAFFLWRAEKSLVLSPVFSFWKRPSNACFNRLSDVSMRFVLCLVFVFMSGCASQTRSAVNSLDRQSPSYTSDTCLQAAQLADLHDDIKQTRVISTPLVFLASGGSALLLVLATNMGLDALDRFDASHVFVSCGGVETPAFNIAEEVVLGAGFNLFTQSFRVGGN
jgi:hypothetical protein